MPLGPVFMLRPHRGGKRRGLIALDMGDVGLDFLLHLVYGLTHVSNGATRAEFCLAVPRYLTARDHRAQPVACQPDTMDQNRKRRTCVGHILWPLVQAQTQQLCYQGQ